MDKIVNMTYIPLVFTCICLMIFICLFTQTHVVNTEFFRSACSEHVHLFPLVYSHILLLILLHDYHYFILELFNKFIICYFIPP
jgi:hypothetical protein